MPQAYTDRNRATPKLETGKSGRKPAGNCHGDSSSRGLGVNIERFDKRFIDRSM